MNVQSSTQCQDGVLFSVAQALNQPHHKVRGLQQGALSEH